MFHDQKGFVQVIPVCQCQLIFSSMVRKCNVHTHHFVICYVVVRARCSAGPWRLTCRRVGHQFYPAGGATAVRLRLPLLVVRRSGARDARASHAGLARDGGGGGGGGAHHHRLRETHTDLLQGQHCVLLRVNGQKVKKSQRAHKSMRKSQNG